MGFRIIHLKFFVIVIALILLIDSANAKGGGRGGGGKSRGRGGGGGGGGGLEGWKVVLIVLGSLLGLICCCGFCMQICEDEGNQNKPINDVVTEDVRLEMTSMLNTGTTTTTTTENSATHTLISNGGTAAGWTFESSSSNDNGVSKSYVVINNMPK